MSGFMWRDYPHFGDWGYWMLSRLKRLLNIFISPEDVKPGDTLVWDTSSLSHAFEKFSHAVMSAYLEMDEPKTWVRLKARIRRRIDSEATSRKLLLECDSTRCLMPRGVLNELRYMHAYDNELDIMLGMGWKVEKKYTERLSGRGSPEGFTEVFKPRLEVDKPRSELVDYVLSVAQRYGFNINRTDAEGIALALERNAILVTADKKQAELADLLGLRVVYTIAPKKKRARTPPAAWRVVVR